MNTNTSHGTLFREGPEGLELKYFMFDWDDNILHMPTRIHLERPGTGDEAWVPWDVSTAEFARVRRELGPARPRGGSWDSAFADFYDNGPRGPDVFVDDVRQALEGVLSGRETAAPSFGNFRSCLVESRLFAIVTARSHGAEAIRRGVEYFIERVLTPAEFRQMIGNQRGFMRYFGERADDLDDAGVLRRYLDLNHYSGVSSPEFQRRMGRTDLNSAESPEKAKQFAIEQFVRHVLDLCRSKAGLHQISIGFSDDDVHNVEAVEQFLRVVLSRELPAIKFVVYDTSAGSPGDGRKIVIRHGG